jgi:hypothetical protein
VTQCRRRRVAARPGDDDDGQAFDVVGDVLERGVAPFARPLRGVQAGLERPNAADVPPTDVVEVGANTVGPEQRVAIVRAEQDRLLEPSQVEYAPRQQRHQAGDGDRQCRPGRLSPPSGGEQRHDGEAGDQQGDLAACQGAESGEHPDEDSGDDGRPSVVADVTYNARRRAGPPVSRTSPASR